ncbi:MAG: ABC transporter substrate-binding protein [Marmoricola sp.]
MASTNQGLRRAWIAVVTALMLSATACGGSAISPTAAASANCKANGDCNNGGGGNGGGGTGVGSGIDAGVGTGTPSSGASGAAGSTSGGGSGASGGSGGSGGGASTTGGTGSATAGLAAGSCAGFKNGPGITATTITIGNSSDISGPVPGLFTAAQQATKAYVAYFNATSTICGRKLKLFTQDSQTSGSGDQLGYQNLCSNSFAGVGSMSAFDSGGAQTAQSCGLPDIRTAITTNERAACSTCFASQGSNAAYYENAPFTYFFTKYPSVKSHLAFAYLNAGGSAENAQTMRSVAQKLGATNVDMEQLGVSDLSYDSYVQSMKSKGVQMVVFTGAYQNTVKMQQSMKSNGFAPKVFLQDPTIYDPAYVNQASSAGVGNGTYVYANFLPFSLASTNKEMSTYLAWLQQVAPGANPTFYGVFAWSAAALFVRQAILLGGKLNRASLVSALRGVNNWTDNGMTAPQNVGGKINGSCWRMIQLQGGRWNPLGGYQCDGVTHR